MPGLLVAKRSPVIGNNSPRNLGLLVFFCDHGSEVAKLGRCSFWAGGMNFYARGHGAFLR